MYSKVLLSGCADQLEVGLRDKSVKDDSKVFIRSKQEDGTAAS